MIAEIELYNFRNFSNIKINLDSNINIITGSNGSGKSSILEAIYYLSRGRSFRAANPNLMINDDQNNFTIRAALSDKTILASERYRSGKIRHKLNDQDCSSMLELSENIPILFLDTDSQRWLAAGPKNRRKTIDWGLFYGRKSEFYKVWTNFRRSLLQRNSAIKANMDFSTWDKSFIEYSLQLSQQRERYIQDLELVFNEIWQECNLGPNWGAINLLYKQGWSNELANALYTAQHRDKQLGYTSIGPHRSDLIIKISGKLAHTHLSQGQQKLLTYAITVAQATLYQRDSGNLCLLLLDDLCAELDLDKRSSIVNFLLSKAHQMLITGIVASEIKSIVTREFNHIEI